MDSAIFFGILGIIFFICGLAGFIKKEKAIGLFLFVFSAILIVGAFSFAGLLPTFI